MRLPRLVGDPQLSIQRDMRKRKKTCKNCGARKPEFKNMLGLENAGGQHINQSVREGAEANLTIRERVKVNLIFWGGGGSSHDKPPELAHQKALEKSLGIKHQSYPVLQLSHNTDITRNEDKLYLIPGNAVGTATPESIPVCY